jgi:dTDP-glucose 4,6-dehydratase
VKNKNILITGGAGFIGHAVIEYLLKNSNYNIVSLDRLDCSSDLNRLGELIQENPKWRNRIRFVWHDLKSPVSNNTIEKIGRIHIVLHLAAGSHVTRSVKDPMSFVMDNVVGTCNILEFARKFCTNLEMFLYFSTDEVFGPAKEGEIFHENSRYNACNPYSASKAGGEELCNAYYNTYNMPIITTHTMNVYGPKQHEEKFIPTIIDKIMNDKILEVHTDKHKKIPARRSYLYSHDVGSAILFLIENFKAGEKYNISSSYELDGLSLAQKISKIIGKNLKFILSYPEKERPGNDFRYSVSGDKMLSMGWKQTFSIDEGLERTVKWYLEKYWSENENISNR